MQELLELSLEEELEIEFNLNYGVSLKIKEHTERENKQYLKANDFFKSCKYALTEPRLNILVSPDQESIETKTRKEFLKVSQNKTRYLNEVKGN